MKFLNKVGLWKSIFSAKASYIVRLHRCFNLESVQVNIDYKPLQATFDLQIRSTFLDPNFQSTSTTTIDLPAKWLDDANQLQLG